MKINEQIVLLMDFTMILTAVEPTLSCSSSETDPVFGGGLSLVGAEGPIFLVGPLFVCPKSLNLVDDQDMLKLLYRSIYKINNILVT